MDPTARRRPHDNDIAHRGLADHLGVLERRRALKLFGAAGAVGLLTLVGCGGDDGEAISTTSSPSTTSSAAAETAAVEPIPEETGGPYPADGTNGPNVLSDSGVVRRDITSSFGEHSGVAEGVPLNVELTILDHGNGNAPYAGAAVYLWHCDAEGRYSLYSQGATDQNYLRGVQEADANGKLTFTTIFPAAYSGRWPHIHFEVFPTLDAATSASSKVTTSQLALPEDVCNAVYDADSRYSASIRNMQQTSLESDNVFRDGVELQMATVTGSVSGGYMATLTATV